jgi:hypothetical protein
VHDVGNVVKVVDLILPGLNDLIRIQPFRHVAGYGHAEAVGFVGDGLHFFELHRAVDLHLLEASIVVAIDPLPCLLGSIGARHSDSHWAGAVDKACEEKARTKAASLGNRVAHGFYEFKFVAAIADGGDTGGEIDWPPLDLLEVCMHVPKSG